MIMSRGVQHSPVTRDSTLDAFVSESASEETTGSSLVDAAEESPEVEPTSDWSPDGAPCTNCGTVVSRRWRQDGELLCPTCKDWDGV